jgi:hypothetical protein
MFSSFREYTSGEMSQRQFWTEAYLVALARVDADAAIVEADEALRLCNKQWCEISLVKDVRPVYSYPLGVISGGRE